MSNDLERGMQQLREVHAIQGKEGCWDIDDYMLGMFNGLELALSLMENRETKYKTRKEIKQAKQEPTSELLHSCPYREELYGDYQTLCDCDEEQMYQCAQDI